MQTCQQLTEEVTRYLDGELTMAEWAQTRVHLMLCPACRLYLEQMKHTCDALARLGHPPPPEEVTVELLRRYREWRERLP